MEVTFSKQWIHFRLSERCPPTSTILLDWIYENQPEDPIIFAYRKMIESKSNGYSIIPVVGWRALKISCSVGK